MSVLIKGMKMPKDEEVRILLFPNGQVFIDNGVYFLEYELEYEAVEVPTPHGRLIDADELEVDTEWSDYYDGYQSYSAMQIKYAPTVLESEERYDI